MQYVKDGQYLNYCLNLKSGIFRAVYCLCLLHVCNFLSADIICPSFPCLFPYVLLFPLVSDSRTGWESGVESYSWRSELITYVDTPVSDMN